MRKCYDYERFDATSCCFDARLHRELNPTLLSNFFKCAKWIEENCPNLNGEFRCKHDPYGWTKLVVENGKAYLECGSHGYDFSYALSTTETATFSRGSCQTRPRAYRNVFFFRNDGLEEFLSQWIEIKQKIIVANRVQSAVFSDNFTA